MTNIKPIKDILGDILADTFATYVQVLPHGLRLPAGSVIPQITGELFRSSPARTLYKNGKPSCRSLDGVRSLKTKKACSSCRNRNKCTPQFRLDLMHSAGLLRFLLAYTSARNYMSFLSSLHRQQCPVEGSTITIDVIDRGHWGELRFAHLNGEKTAGDGHTDG